MRHLTREELNLTKGGFHFNVGAALGAMVGGFLAGGPIGLGFAIGTVLVATGTNNLHDMCKDEGIC